MIRILVVEDDATTRKILSAALSRWGYEPVCAATAREGRARLAESGDIRLVLLDRGLPDGDGLRVCRALKADPRTRHLPVIVLTALDALNDELGTYKSGADLHLKKPIDLPVLKRYVETFLDRIPYRREDAQTLTCGALILTPRLRKVVIAAESLENFPAALFDLLYLLASKQGQAVPARSILQKLWGGRVRDSQLAVNISRLRRRLGPRLAPIVMSLRGTGYRIDVDFRPPRA